MPEIRGNCWATNQDYFFNGTAGDACIFQRTLGDLGGTQDKRFSHADQIGAGDVHFKFLHYHLAVALVFQAANRVWIERRLHFGRRQFNFSLFRRPFQTRKRLPPSASLSCLRPIEFFQAILLNQPGRNNLRDQSLINVGTAKEIISSMIHYMDCAFFRFNDRCIKRAAAEVKHEPMGFFTFGLKAEGECCCCRLKQQWTLFETSQLSRFFGGIALFQFESRRHGDDCRFNRLSGLLLHVGF